MRAGVLKVEGGGRRAHTERYLDSIRVGVLKVEGGWGGVYTERYLDSMRVGVPQG